MDHCIEVAEIAHMACNKKVDNLRKSMGQYSSLNNDIDTSINSLDEKNAALGALILEVKKLQVQYETLRDDEVLEQLQDSLKDVKVSSNQMIAAGKITASENGQEDVLPKENLMPVNANTDHQSFSRLIDRCEANLQPISVAEFKNVPDKVRGPLGRLQAIEMLKVIKKLFDEKYKAQRRRNLNSKAVNEKLKGRCFISNAKFLEVLTPRLKVYSKFGIPSLAHLQRIEVIECENDVTFLAIVPKKRSSSGNL